VGIILKKGSQACIKRLKYKSILFMGYIDILIPLIAGIFFIASPQSIIKPDDPLFEKKKSIYQKGGYTLVGVAVLYGIIKILS
jgi:hypothetical protein